jgi:hypothetical protein
MLGVALGSGVLLGVLVGGPSSTRRDPRDADTERRAQRGSHAGQRIEETWLHISDALLGVASAKVMEVIGTVVPGFTDQLDQQARGRSRNL